ncbi:MAG: AMP-dependent synthetase/ligase [Anaerovoracaceae bacterium]
MSREKEVPGWYEDIREISDLKELLNGSAELFADRPAFWIKKFKGDEYHPITYAQLKRDVDALGTQMLAMGLAGQRIGIMGQGCYEWFVTYLAVVNGVGVAVPVDREFDSAMVQNVLDTAESTTLFFTSGEEKKVRKLTGIKNLVRMEVYGDRTDEGEPLHYKEEQDGILAWKHLLGDGYGLLAEGNTHYLDARIDNQAMAVLLFTSGTTGNPKGVMLSHWNIAFDVMEIARAEEILPEDITLSVLPIHHTYESTGTLLFLYRGASIAYSEGLKFISKNMLEIHNSFFIAVPLLLETVYERIWKTARKQGKEKLLKRAIKLNNKARSLGLDFGNQLFRSIKNQLGGRLRMVVSGAAAVSPEIVRGFADLGISIVSGYGLTETAPMITATPSFSDQRYKKAGSAGICIRNGQLKIVDPDEDGIGEIWFKGDNVMLGYYNMPELTAETIVDGWFNTGDLGFLDSEGWLYITGRKKNIIVTKTGENIYPEEIESMINQSEFVSDSMVYALDRNGQETVAVQLLPNLENLAERYGTVPSDEEIRRIMEEIISQVNDQLPTFKVIRDVTVRKDDFVRTTTKKIRRSENI